MKKDEYVMNAVEMAWKKAIERKLGHKVEVKTYEDLRILARLAVSPKSPEVVVYGD